MGSSKRLLPSPVPEVCEENVQIAEECRLTLAPSVFLGYLCFSLPARYSDEFPDAKQTASEAAARNFSPLP